MKKPKHTIDRLRQNYLLRCMALAILWISMAFSIPQVNIDATFVSPQIQRILPPDSLPIASPSNLIRATIEYAEFFVTVLNEGDIEKHLHTYTILKQCSSDHARALTNVLLYTQTTSSFL